MQLSILRVPSSFEMMNAMPVTLEQPAFESARPRSVFIPRFISTIVLWSIALAIAFSGYEVFFWLLISAFGLIALLEFYRMLDHAHLPNFKITTKILYLTPRASSGVASGQFYCLYLIAVTKFSDMGAYLTGSAIGRHLMVPQISAKKTWEGFFGALALALLCSLALFKLMPGHLAMLSWTHATILGLLLGFAAVIGDLAESIIKRSTGVKDSGNFLPGIGGALDLIDSLLFTAPLLFFYLRLVIRVA